MKYVHQVSRAAKKQTPLLRGCFFANKGHYKKFNFEKQA